MTFDIKELEVCLAEITHNGKDLYPKELGNGLWQISDNTITKLPALPWKKPIIAIVK